VCQDYKKPNIWNQLKSKTSSELLKAVQKDENWEFVNSIGSRHVFTNRNNPISRQIVSVHWHKSDKSGYGRAMLRDLLETIDWTEEEMKALKLIKKK